MPLLYAAIGAALLYILQEKLYRKFWDLGLDANIKFAETAVKEGDSCVLQEVVSNQKWLPLPLLHVKFQLHRKLVFLEEENISQSDLYYKHDVFSLLPYQRITRNIKIQCTGRGYYEITSVSLVSTNLFFAGSLACNPECGAYLYVYPVKSSLAALKIPFRKMMGTVLTDRRLYEDPFEFRGIRPYQSYDSMKDINWKASAKTGEWKVNQHHDTSSQEVRILLNLEDCGVRVHEDLQEESIRIAYTLLEWFVKQGVETGIYSNGRDIVTRMPVEVPKGAGGPHAETAARALARLDLRQKKDAFSGILSETGNSGDALLILVSSNQGKDLQREADRLSRNPRGFYWIAPVNEEIPREISLPAENCFYLEVNANEKN